MRKPIRRLVNSLYEANQYLFFVALILICIVAISIGVYAQFFYKYADTDPLMLGINVGAKKTAEEYALLKSNFEEIFENTLKINSENLSVDKLDSEKDIVYTAYHLVNEDETYYSVDVNIPEINLDSDVAKKMNAEIKSEYYNKANSIMRQTQGNTIYKVSYASYINRNVLSVVIKASLKEQGKSEKVSMKTYTYSILGEEMVSLEDLIKVKGTTTEEVQNSIYTEIKTAAANAQIIANEYGTLYQRNLESEQYKVQNATEYFLTDDGYVYIIYAYGNQDYTNERDIVIF